MPNVTEPAPDVDSPDFMHEDEQFSLHADHSGKFIIVSFLEHNIFTCQPVINWLVELWGKYESDIFQIVVVFCSINDTELAAVKSWLGTLNVDFPAINDIMIYNNYMTDIDPLQTAIPHTFIIDRSNTIRERYYRDNHPICDDLETDLLNIIYEREPIDLEMVMDVSGSMNSPSPNEPDGATKLFMMKEAISITGDFLLENGQSTDKMGLIWFTDDVVEYQNSNDQKLFPIPANWENELRVQVNSHGTGNCTAMGAGLQTAFNTLKDSDQKKFVILCTDGMQNRNPLVIKVDSHHEIRDGYESCGLPSQNVEGHIGTAISSYETCVYTIGVGITANYEPLLQEIAAETNAFYKGTNDPETDLDFVYTVQLCDCMAGRSPSILYHNTGELREEEYEKEETFYLNSSIRKVTVILSWKKFQGSNFMFWLYSPDETLLNLHSEMRIYENHCMATIYLPRQQDGEILKFIGEWRMVIRGELSMTSADYHVIIIGEDTDVKFLVDSPRKLFEVGDKLPITVAVLKGKKPIVVKPKEIAIEMKFLPEPLPKLLSEYKISLKELLQQSKLTTKKAPKNHLILKLNAMTSDPQFQKRLMPFTKQFSLQEGNLEYKIEKEKIIIPIALEQPGLHSFKIKVRYEDPENGPICRTNMVSIIVGPGKADPEHTKINFIEPSTDKLKGKIINVTPRNKEGQLLGPGYSNEFKLQVGKEDIAVKFEDLLDGTYQIELPVSEKEMVKIKEKELDVDITFHNNLIWTGKL